MTTFKHICGLVAAPFTPLDDAGELDLGRVGPLARSLADAGVVGAFVGGTTGECLSLSVAERMMLAESWRREAPEGFSVLVHVGANCLADARALAAHARSVGVDAIAAFAPSYHRPITPQGLAEFCRCIAAETPDLPFYYYHIPFMTHLAGPLYHFFEAAGPRIPTLAGAKFTDEDLMDFLRCLRAEDGRYDMLFGRDEMLLSALAAGAHGAVGTTYTFAAPLFGEMLAAFERGDLSAAADAQARAVELIAIYNAFGGLPAGKAIMKLIGLDCGPVRLPLMSLPTPRVEELRGRLDDIGFFDYCVRA